MDKSVLSENLASTKPSINFNQILEKDPPKSTVGYLEEFLASSRGDICKYDNFQHIISY